MFSYCTVRGTGIIIRYSFMILIAMTAVTAVELSYNFGTRGRTILFVASFLSVLFFITIILVRIFQLVISVAKHPRAIVSEIDSCNTEFKLLLIYDLMNMEQNSELRDSAIKDITEDFKKQAKKPDIFTPAGTSFSFAKVAGILSTGLFLLLFSGPAIFRIYHYDKDFTLPPSHTLTLLQTQITAADGDSIILSCVSGGKHPDIVTLNKRYVDKNLYSEFKIPPENDSIYYYSTSESESFYYFFSTHEASTDTAFVTVYKRRLL